MNPTVRSRKAPKTTLDAYGGRLCSSEYSSPGRSGLGLEAQRSAIKDFAPIARGEVEEWFTEAESGSGSGALEKRPQLAAAIAAARRLRAAVLVAKLDRPRRDE
jgi:DNA invertase Pin-like site-specific DNA recombinase